MKRISLFLGLISIIVFGMVYAQVVPWLNWTFLPKAQMDEIIGEASGETAWQTIASIAAFNRDRLPEEFSGTFWETEYVFDQLKRYGLQGVEIVTYPGGEAWDGIKGELWEVKPMRQKIASYNDMVPMLAYGSSPADVTGELVWVGRGTTEEIRTAKVEGKIVVTEGNIMSVHGEACIRQGALGIIAINMARALHDPLQLPWSGVGGMRGRPDGGQQGQQQAPPPQPKFGFQIPAREGEFLKRRLIMGEKITVQAKVESRMVPYDLENVTCFIPGEDPNAGEIIFSAHLFEGIAKQGANDNISGSAGILEVARILHTLFQEGRLPKPKRTIRFIWGPEFSGIGKWVQANRKIMEKTLCGINMDMVGEWLSKNQAFNCLMRTTYGNPHFINDVMENYYRFVGEGNRERVQNRSTAYPALNRIVAPFGSDEPFYYSIEAHYGASDHEVFNDWAVGVPAAMMNAWPDRWYHMSGDLADKADPTQMKRAAIIGAAAGYTVASADDAMAIRIAAETLSNGTRRLGIQFAAGLEALNGATAKKLAEAYRSANVYVEAATTNEKETLDSILELASDKVKVGNYIARLKKTVETVGGAHLAALQAHMEATAARLGTKPPKVAISELEKQAAKIIPKPTEKVRLNGYNEYRKFIDQVPKAEKDKYPYAQFGGGNSISSLAELQCLINGRRNALEIKIMLDAQSQRPSSLQGIINYIQVLKLAGLVEVK